MAKKSHRDTLEQMIEAKRRAGDGPGGSRPPARPRVGSGLACFMRCNICGEEWQDDGRVECPACGSDDYDVGEWRDEEEET